MSQPPNLPRLSLLHATRGRPSQARECRRNWLDAAAMPERVEHIFAVDADDADSIRGLADLNPRVVERAGGGCVAAWNLAASVSTGDVLIQLSDDWSPVQNWDEEFVKRLRDVSQPGVLRVSDGRRTDDLLCMAICTRPWMLQQGELLHSGYVSLYSDDEFSFRAYQHGGVIDARDIVLMHHHPNYDESIPLDETYTNQNSEDRKKRGHETFLQRNPTANGHWLHEGIWDRLFVPMGAEGHGGSPVVAGLRKECARLTAQCGALQADNDHLRKIAESAMAWQKRSWFTRALHRWRPPGPKRA
ncbi:MAG: hypothetical protein WCK55_13610 [Verrucomicrobiota bacterium]